MKKFLLLTASLCLFSCGSEEAQKPERLLSEEQMENILYDLTLLQTMSSVTPQEIQRNDIDVKNYIYNKYNIDSLTLVENQKYYAYNIENYQKIQKRVLERVKAVRTPLDSVSKEKADKKLEKTGITPVIE